MDKRFAFGALILAALLLAGCSGGVDQTDLGADTGIDTGDTGSAEDGTADSSGSADDTGSDSEGMDMEGPSFMDIVSEKKSSSYMVDYEYSTSGMDEDVSGEMALYLDSPKQRIDSKFEMNGQKMEARTYIEGDGYTVCFQQDGEWTCMEMDMSQYKSQSSAGSQATSGAQGAEENPSDYNINPAGTRNIAGETAYCFEVQPKDSEGTTTACYNNDGVMLYAQYEGPDYTVTSEAMDYSMSVSDSDFVPPAEPMDMGGYTSGMDTGDLENMQME
ncbi:MAG: hypothetical protein R6U32_05010 [Candidatus Woesearchaeota archaeon]